MLKDLKISTRLTAALALLVAIILALSGLALVQMGSMRAATEDIAGNWLPSVGLVNAMNTNTSDFRIGEYAHVMSTVDADMARFEKDIAAVRAEFDRNRDAYVKLINSDEERKLYDSFASDWKAYLEVHARMIEASRKNENDRARTLLDNESRLLYDKASATLLKLVELNNAGAAAATKVSDDAYASARNALAVGVLLALAIAAVAGFWLVRSISVPLAKAVTAAGRVADGDFTQTIDAQGEDEAAQVLKALDRMQTRLADVVATVRGNAESVATASAQIAQGNADLSSRTEEQASALEQTAASMEELSSTVKQNADNARQGNQLAQTASSVAVRGGEVVGQVVDTMKGINEASRKIADIIGVIDGIAFQTNILALNAAVEAARAGEQGRGFAVVASEVRSLAGRSAEAAKEIKSLISDSVQRVEQGSALVDQAGATMTEVVSNIRRVTDIMGEISAASTEQSEGVAQVGEAVTQMDQATQQNAALVEESAAAAESLKAQAQQLVQTVAVFKIAGATGGQPALPAVSSLPRSTTPPAFPTAERRTQGRSAASPRKAPLESSASKSPAPMALDTRVPTRKAAEPGDDWTSF